MRTWIALAAAFVLHAQPPQAPQPLKFEVASVKPGRPDAGVTGGCHGIDSAPVADAPPLGRCEISDGRLSHMVGIAWDVPMSMLKQNADWIQFGNERFNLVARAENPSKTTEKQLLQMLQGLLIERFHMKYHLEPVTMPGFALTLAKGGSKLQPTKSEAFEFSIGGGSGKPGPDAGMIKVKACPMRELVRLLSIAAGRGPGIDRTGLTGSYDFTLAWNTETGPTIETALHEQLGLRIESEKVPTNYFVIDSASRPSEN